MVISLPSVSIAADSTSANLFAGNLFETLPTRSVLILRLAGAATGLLCNFFVGGVAIAQAAAVPASNRFPISPDDVIAQVGGRGGEKVFLTVQNTTAAALVLNGAVLDIL